MGAIRVKLLAEAHEPEVHKPLFEQLIAADLLSLVKDQRTNQIDKLLETILGPGYCYHQLMTSNRLPQE
jgi:precorrin-2 dehydrogenase/sirohydrochlorin ferrochelatase